MSLQEQWHHRTALHDKATTVPISADGVVYYAYQARARKRSDTVTRLVALDAASGQQRWQQSSGYWVGDYAPPHGPLPVVHGDMVYFGLATDDTIGAYAAANGAQQWTTLSRGGERLAVPGAGLLHVIRRDAAWETSTGTVVGLDPLSGTPVWSTDFEDRSFRYPTFDGAEVYYPLDHRDDGEPDQVAVLDPETGTEKRRFDRSIQSFAPVHDGRLYTAQWASERIAAIDTASGDVVWENHVQYQHDVTSDGEDLTVNARYLFGGVTDDRLLVLKRLHGYSSDEILAYDPATGDLVWQVRPDAVSDMVRFLNQPIIVGESVFVTGTHDPKDDSRSGFVQEFDVASGELLDEQALSSPSFTPPIVAGDRLFVVAWDGVHAFG